jgi:hypothetical protein
MASVPQGGAWWMTQRGSLRRSQAKTLVACMAGLIRDGHLGVAAIGRGMPGPVAPKPRIKRVDRFLSTARLDRDAASADLIRLVVMGRKVVRVILDWTDVHDGHQTLVAAIVTGHRRALPVAAETVATADLTLRQNAMELAFLRRVRRLFPSRLSAHPARRPRLLSGGLPRGRRGDRLALCHPADRGPVGGHAR